LEQDNLLSLRKDKKKQEKNVFQIELELITKIRKIIFY